MFLKYKPTWMVSSIYQITPEQLKKLGIKETISRIYRSTNIAVCQKISCQILGNDSA